MNLCGGLTAQAKVATPDVQAMIDSNLQEINSKLDAAHESLTAVEYKTQVVAGTNYIVKCKTSGEEHVHVVLFKPLPHVSDSVTVVNAKGGLSVDAGLSLSL